jgi:hypothetical protein
MSGFHPTWRFALAAPNAAFEAACRPSRNDDGATGFEPEPTFSGRDPRWSVYREPTFGKGQAVMAAARAGAYRATPLERPVVPRSNAAA